MHSLLLIKTALATNGRHTLLFNFIPENPGATRPSSLHVLAKRGGKVFRVNPGARFYPSRCGGHKNLENVATFSKFLGRRKNLAPG